MKLYFYTLVQVIWSEVVDIHVQQILEMACLCNLYGYWVETMVWVALSEPWSLLSFAITFSVLEVTFDFSLFVFTLAWKVSIFSFVTTLGVLEDTFDYPLFVFTLAWKVTIFSFATILGVLEVIFDYLLFVVTLALKVVIFSCAITLGVLEVTSLLFLVTLASEVSVKVGLIILNWYMKNSFQSIVFVLQFTQHSTEAVFRAMIVYLLSFLRCSLLIIQLKW